MVIDMTHTEAITKIRKQKKLRVSDIMGMLQLNSRGSVEARIKNKGVRLCTLVELLDVLGYEMVVQPKTGEPPPEGVYNITVPDYGSMEETT